MAQLIKFDQAQIDAATFMLAGIPGAAEKVFVRSLNATAKRSKTLASTEIRKQISLKPQSGKTPKQYVDSKLTVTQASKNKIRAAITAPSRGLLLSNYRYNVLKRGGVSVKVKKAFKKIPTAFIVTNLKYSGATGIATRDPKTPSRIDVKHGPSVSQVFTDVKDDIAPEMNALLVTEFDRAFSGVLRGF